MKYLIVITWLLGTSCTTTDGPNMATCQAACKDSGGMQEFYGGCDDYTRCTCKGGK